MWLWFAYGFGACWVLLATLALICDEKQWGGLQLFDGWMSNLLVLPLIIVFLGPRLIIFRIIRKRRRAKEHRVPYDPADLE